MTDYSKPSNPVDGNVNEDGMNAPVGPATQTPTVPANDPKHIRALQNEEEPLRELYPIKMLPPDNENWYQLFCKRYNVTDDPTVQGANMERMHKGDLQSRPAWEYNVAADKANSVKHVSTDALYERQRTLIMNSSKRLQQIIDGTHLISNWNRSQNNEGDIVDENLNELGVHYHAKDAAAYCGVRSEDVNDLVSGKGLVKQRLSDLRLRDRQDAHEMQLIARELQARDAEPHPKLTNEEQARYEELQEMTPKFSLLVHETNPNKADHPAGPDDKPNKKVVDAVKNNTSNPKMDTDSTEPAAPINKDVENNGIEHTTSVVDEQGAGKAAETAARIERDHQPTPAENLEELDQRCQNYLVQNPDAIPGRKLRLRMAAQMGINARTGKPEKPFFSRMRDLKDRMVEVNDHARELKWRDKTASEKVWTGVRKGGHIAKQLGKGIGITSLVVAFGIAGWVLTKSHKGITNMAATMNNSIINGMVNGLDPHARQLMGNMLDDGPQR